MKKPIYAAFFIFILAVPSVAAQELDALRAEAGLQRMRQEREMIDFRMETLSGQSARLNDHKGKVILMNFWASWCVPCREEMPAIERVYNRLKDEGFTVLAINQRETRSTVRDFVDEYELTFPILLDKSGRVGSTYGARGLPLSYVVNREGLVVSGASGEREWDSEEMVAYFRALLEQGQ